MYKFVAVSLFLLITACGGGGGGGGGGGNPTVNVNADGLWEGTFTDSGVNYNMTGIIYDNKFIGISIDAGVMYTGNIGVTGSQMAGSVDVIIINGGFDHTTTVSATVTEGVSIVGSATDPGGTSTFSLSYDPDGIWNRTPNLATLAGTYSITSGLYTYTKTIANDGSYTGSDSDGCNYSGTFTPFDSTHNYYRMTMTVTNCGVDNGTYIGSAILSDFNVTNDNLVLIIDDLDFILILGMLRQ